ncbi:MAG: type II toxin-antitoxin system prevent-host-death family antitoxin [Actinomycetota bacterium]|nr:type II toxin-antitoxin system prevent-host-death family antitoxin [Actinomycetota bacterium]
MTKSVGVHEAKTHLSRLIEEVERGEEIVITRRGTEVARLVPRRAPAMRQFGRDEGVWSIPDDFDDPLPEEIQAAFEGRGT